MFSILKYKTYGIYLINILKRVFQYVENLSESYLQSSIDWWNSILQACFLKGLNYMLQLYMLYFRIESLATY